MISKMYSKLEFKKENLECWKKNTNYWLNSPLRQVEDTKSFFTNKLKEILFNNCIIFDLGCGSGWLIDLIQELNISVKYIGIDFNKKFIDFLNGKFNNSNYEFILADLEEPLNQKYYNKADFVFNNFNFFEIANLESAFDNAYQFLKKDGSLIISTIDVTYLVVAISKNFDEFKQNLVDYEKTKNGGNVPYFFQPIDLGYASSNNLRYASVLYSLADYFRLAKSKGLSLIDYDEIICTSRFIPKIYQYIQFSKKSNR